METKIIGDIISLNFYLNKFILACIPKCHIKIVDDIIKDVFSYIDDINSFESEYLSSAINYVRNKTMEVRCCDLT